MIGLGLIGLAVPATAVIVAFSGVVENIRLSLPHLYPFKFDKKLMLYLRAGTTLYLLLGIAGVIIQWDSIANFIQAISNWVNE